MNNVGLQRVVRDGDDSDMCIECYLGTTQHSTERANNVGEPGRQVHDIEKVFKSKKLFTTQAVVSSRPVAKWTPYLLFFFEKQVPLNLIIDFVLLLIFGKW